mgnify:CR=1 FL=1
MQIINDTSAMIPEPCVATIGFFDGVHMGHRYLIQQVKEIAAAKGLRSALVTFPVHPRKVMNAAYHPELLTTPERKNKPARSTGVDYCLMLDFYARHLPSDCQRIHDSDTERTLSGK